jgi:hypothetical protein
MCVITNLSRTGIVPVGNLVSWLWVKTSDLEISWINRFTLRAASIRIG